MIRVAFRVASIRKRSLLATRRNAFRPLARLGSFSIKRLLRNALKTLHRSVFARRTDMGTGFRLPLQCLHKEKTAYRRFFLYGGGGSRTRVRKPIHETFSGCRASFVIPLTAAGAQAAARVAFLCMTASKAKRLFTSATYMMSMRVCGIPLWATGVSGTLRRTSCT